MDSGGSAKFGAVSFACGKKCRDDAACASSCIAYGGWVVGTTTKPKLGLQPEGCNST
jgi:hypothetical protein